MNATEPEQPTQEQQDAVMRLTKARIARDRAVQSATEQANAAFWQAVAREIRTGRLSQKEAAMAIGYHRETLRRNVELAPPAENEDHPE